MDDYISRQAAIDACYDGCADCRDDCAANIRNLPPADVRSVMRGVWEHLNCGFDYDRCSVCGYERWPGPFYFCPNCGADMRGMEV